MNHLGSYGIPLETGRMKTPGPGICGHTANGRVIFLKVSAKV